MALQASGQISVSQINIESRKSSTAQISLGSAEPRTIANKIPGNSQIKFSDLYGRTYGSSVLFAGTLTGSPYIHAWKWNRGFGTKYSDPATLPPLGVRSLFSPPSRAVIGSLTGSSTNRFTSFYSWSDSSGFGTRFSLSGSYPTGGGPLGTGGENIVWNGNGNVVFLLNGGTSSTAGLANVVAFIWSDSTGFGTKYADPSLTIARGDSMTIEGSENRWHEYPFASNDEDVIMAQQVSPWIVSNAFNSSTGWGTRYSNPSIIPGNATQGVTSDGSVVYTSNISTSDFRNWSSTYTKGVGWGTKFSDTNLGITDITSGIAIPYVLTGSIAPFVVSITSYASPYITTAIFSGGMGSVYSNPAILPAGDGEGVSYNNKIDLAVAHDNSPYLSVYPWTPSGYGTKYSDPLTTPSGDGKAVHFFYTQFET